MVVKKITGLMAVVLVLFFSGCSYWFFLNSHYETVFDKQMHYIDVGDKDKPVVMVLHGNPISSYGYRDVIPYLQADNRVIALDMFNHGLSDKGYPMDLASHQLAVNQFIEQMGFEDVTLLLHDWGFPVGMSYVMQHPENVKAIAFMEVFLAYDHESELPLGMQNVRNNVTEEQFLAGNLFIEQVLFNSIPELTEADREVYRHPFRDMENRRQTWLWPNAIPVRETSSQHVAYFEQIEDFMKNSDIPKLLMYAEPGVFVTPQKRDYMIAEFNNLSVEYVGEGKHWLQESHSDEVGMAVRSWLDQVVDQ